MGWNEEVWREVQMYLDKSRLKTIATVRKVKKCARQTSFLIESVKT